MKKRLIHLLGYILISPVILSFVISIAGMIAHKSSYEKWLFEGCIFPMLDWADGSYINAIILWLGSCAIFFVWQQSIAWCFTYKTPEDKRTERYKDWLDA